MYHDLIPYSMQEAQTNHDTNDTHRKTVDLVKKNACGRDNLIEHERTEENADNRLMIASPNSTHPTRLGPVEEREQQQKVGAMMTKIKVLKNSILQCLSLNCTLLQGKRQSISRATDVASFFESG